MKIDMAYFNEIEKKYGLYNDCIEGINYWMYCRFDIWNYILSIQNQNFGKACSTPAGGVNKCKSAITLLGTIMFGKKVKKKNVDIVFFNHERKIKSNGIYECKYTEAVSRLYENIYIFERPYERGHLKPAYSDNLIYLDYIAVKGNLKYQVIRRFCKKKYKHLLQEIEKKIHKPMEELQAYLPVSLDYKYIVELIARRVLICSGKYKEYEKVFQKIHPKLIVEVVHYNMDCMIVNEIARKKGIRIVELQHGNIYNSHVPYQYKADTQLNQLPDEIWLLSEYWKKEIHMPIDNKYLIPVGFPYFEKRIQEYQEKYEKKNDKKTILFISQWTIGKQLSEFAVAFADQCNSEAYRILYKLHPGEVSNWKEQYIELKMCRKIEVIDNREIDLYQLFAQSDIQIGVYSTAIYEGLGFGLDTYICDLAYAEEMRALYEGGFAIFVKSPEELLHFIQKGNLHAKGKEFWTKDSVDNMKKRIEEILDGNV